MIKAFFLVVFMMSSPNGTTPTYILKIPFKELSHCVDFANANRDKIFFQAVMKYRFQIPPAKITCVHVDVLNKLLKGVPA